MSIKVGYSDLLQYVNTASDLAESLALDIKKGSRISSGTVVLLSRFYTAAHRVTPLLKAVDDDNKKLN